MVQWKLCGLTTFTSTALTATPSARPSTAPTPVQTAPSAATTATICAPRQPEVREQPELLAPRQHLRREAGGDAEQADRDRHRLQPVGDGEAAVEDAQRRRPDLARRRELEQRAVVAELVGEPAQARLDLAGRRSGLEPERHVVDAPVAGEALPVAGVEHDRAVLARVVAPDAAHEHRLARCRPAAAAASARRRGRRRGRPSPR